MSTQNNNALMIGGAVLAFLMLRRQSAYPNVKGAPSGYRGAPTMPGSAGVGSSQIWAGALQGFMRAVANTPPQGTYTPTVSVFDDYQGANRADTVQDSGDYDYSDPGYGATDWF